MPSKPAKATMSSSNSPASQSSNNYVEQTVSVLSSVASYMRLPALASTRAETRDHKLMVYGQSLGGAVAIKLVSKNQEAGDIAGLILENTFLSIRKLIPSVVPPAKYLTLLCHQVWPSESVLPNITKVPTLFISGLQDEIVPPKHMKQLYEISAAPTKRWKPLPAGDHNSSVLEEGYFEAMSDFIAEVTDDQEKEKTRS
ncbi:unnamed protein product [Fusarium graminearum]|nr:unnamed protein product [Fusarium graminearum]